MVLGQSLAAEFIVTNLQDDGVGSLRENIRAANRSTGTNTIRFTIDGTIKLHSPLPAVVGIVEFLGRAPEQTIISGEKRTNAFSLFQVNQGASAILRKLTIQQAVSTVPGGAIHNSGRLSIEECLIANNQAMDQGGGIYSVGQLICVSSTICSNTVIGKLGTNVVTTGGGGAFKGTGGGLQIAGGSATMTNCTFSGNVAIGGKGGNNVDINGGGGGGGGGEGSGGGIHVAIGNLLLVNVTITRNRALGGLGGEGSGGGGMGGDGMSRGGGLFSDQGAVQLLNTIISDNEAKAWVDLGPALGGYQSLGHNLLGQIATNQFGTNWWVPSDLINLPAGLEPLGDYGGPTLTHRLSNTSPAIGGGGSLAEGAPILDQRGAVRPQDHGIDIGSVEFGKIQQNVIFLPIADKVYGDTPFQVNAESSSDLPVNYSVVNNLNATESSAVISITGAGSVSVKAVQSGDENHFPASSIQTFNVTKAPLTVSAESLTRPFGQPNPPFLINYSGFKLGENASVLNVPPSLTTLATINSPVGSYPITISGGSDNNYSFQGYSSGTLLITPSPQTIVFDPITTKTYGEVFTTRASSGSGLPVSFTVESGPAISSGPNGSTITLTNLGVVTINANQVGNPNHATATMSQQSFNVEKAPLILTVENNTKPFGQPNPPFQITFSGFRLGETSSVLNTQPLAFTTATTTSPVGTYPINVNGGSDDHYTFQGFTPGTLVITPKPQTIVFDPIHSKTYGDIFSLHANASSGLPVVFTVGSGPAISSGPNGSTITLTNLGVVTINANQAGNPNHGAATLSQQSFNVEKAPLTLRVENQTKPVGQPNPPFQLIYDGFKLGETNTVLNTLPSTSTTATTTSPVGTYQITVTGGSDDHYTFQGFTPGTLVITPKPQTIVFDPIPTKTYGDIFSIHANSSSGLPVIFTVGSGPAISSGPHGSIITVTNLGAVTINANQAGDLNNGAAKLTQQSFTIDKAVLTLTVENHTKTVGQPNPPFRFTDSGFKFGETRSVINTLPSMSTSATVGSPAGTYPITIAGGSDDHYALKLVSGLLEIRNPAPPPIVTIVSQTNGSIYISPITLPIVAEVQNPPTPVKKVEFFAGNVVIGTSTNTPPFVNWTNIPSGTNVVVAEVTFADGMVVDSKPIHITVLPEVPFVLSLVDTNSLLVRQTGLFHQTVTLTNPTPNDLVGIRLLITNLPPNSRVENATGKTNGVSFIQYDQPLPAGQHVDLHVEYYVPSRAVPHPIFSTQLISTPLTTPPTGELLATIQTLKFQNQGNLVEFQTELGKTYFIQYSTNLISWKTAVPSITGNCSKIQWIDTGPPKTQSAPLAMRFYRIISIP